MRKHGDVLQYSLANDSDVMVVDTRDAFYRCLRLHGWLLSEWLASLEFAPGAIKIVMALRL